MNFLLSDAHLRKQEEYSYYVSKLVAPYAEELNKQKQFPGSVLKDLAAQGYLGLPIPVEWGGQGEDFISYILLIEELSKVCASTGGIVAVHTSVGTFPLLYHGTEEQKKKYLNLLATGEWIGAFALTEAGAGSDASAISTKAVKDGDNYILNGSKVFITNGGKADLYTVFANMNPDQGYKGITAFLLEKDTPGLTIGKSEYKMGLHSSVTTELIMDNAVVPANNLLGAEGRGFQVALSLLDGGRIGIGAQGLGIAGAALELATENLKELAVNQDQPAEYPSMLFRLADMATELEAARMLVYKAALKKDTGAPCTKEASMAKLLATDNAMQIADTAVSLLGVYGGTERYIAERLFRDAKVAQIYEGTNQIQRMVIGRQLTK